MSETASRHLETVAFLRFMSCATGRDGDYLACLANMCSRLQEVGDAYADAMVWAETAEEITRRHGYREDLPRIVDMFLLSLPEQFYMRELKRSRAVQAPSPHVGVLASTGEGIATLPAEVVEPGQVAPSPVPAPAEQEEDR